MGLDKLISDLNTKKESIKKAHYFSELAEVLVKEGGWNIKQVIAFANSINDPAWRSFFLGRAAKLWWALSQEQISTAQKCPRSAQFALLLIPKRNREHLIGDLEEEFQTIVLPQYGRFLASCWYFEQAMLAIGYYLWPAMKKILGFTVIYKLIGK
jgi:hypothetical protein